ncbi:MAG: L-lactate dehydrogenase [Ruminococcus sp.]|nr:L-lactate dehydrogenase [Ruminococcus sp.]MBQ7027809.1 L-lactate dehydrogenase [Ruminococcus sp.]MBQ8582447.1 L-lactate dehydrogenase [Ruminococcus sp.]
MAEIKNGTKITILGAGNVGATCAYTFAVTGTCSDVVLIDINKAKAKGEAMDIRQGISFGHNVEVYDGTYEDAAGSDIVVITLGLARKPGQTRLDLAQANVNIIKEVMPQIAKYAPDAIYVVVSNPVDILTYVILKCTNLSPKQVIGSGTALDTSRLRAAIADHVGLSPNSIHAYVFGEHGDSSFIPWSLTNIAGIPMEEYCEDQDHPDLDEDEIIEEVRKAGSEVIKRKGATFYAIAMSVNKICDSILRDANNIITVSYMIEEKYGISDVCLSLPAVIGSNGIEREVYPKLTDDEIIKLQASAKALKNVISQIEF